MATLDQLNDKLNQFGASLENLQKQVNALEKATGQNLTSDQQNEGLEELIDAIPPQSAGSENNHEETEDVIGLVSDNHAALLHLIGISEKRSKRLINMAERRIIIGRKDFHKEIIYFFQTLIELETAQISVPTSRKQQLLEPYYLFFEEYSSILGLYEDNFNTNVQSLHYLIGRGTENALVHLNNLRERLIDILDNDAFDKAKYTKKYLLDILQLIKKVENGINKSGSNGNIPESTN